MYLADITGPLPASSYNSYDVMPQELNQILTAKVAAWNREGLMKSCPYLRSNWQLMIGEGGTVSFPQGCTLWEAANALTGGTVHMLTEVALSGLIGFLKSV